MMRCAIIIGVNKVGQLPTLTAAVQSALDFKDWADSQNIKNTLLTDAAGPVTITMIKDAVKKYVDAQNTDQLILYFSGHGILKGPVDEYWLLSDAPQDPNAAVSLQYSRVLARVCGIPHVVFISDACRSFPATGNFMALMGSSIFNFNGGNSTMANVDMLYATAPGDPAHEIAAGGPQFTSHSVYTRTLLDGLYGKVSSIKESYYRNELVMARKLSDYVKFTVPREAAKINPLLRQVPDDEITSSKPKYLSTFRKPPKLKQESDTKDRNLVVKYETPILSGSIKVPGEKTVYRDTFSFSADATREELEYYTLFDEASVITDMAGIIYTGFIIIGVSDIAEVETPEEFIHKDSSVTYIVLDHLNSKNTYFLRILGGNIYPLAVLPGFIGTLIFKNNVLLTINYTPSPLSVRHHLFRGYSPRITRRRALIALQSKNGKFRIDGTAEQLMEAASYFRNLKAFDPTLGLYAAYAYLQAGDMLSIASIYDYMAAEPEPVLFDVALLTTLTSATPDLSSVGMQSAPFCPMLTQGWSYLAAFDDQHTILRQFAPYRVPGLWTAFRQDAEELINKYIR